MRYLLLNGSPHKGNTWKLTELAKAQIAAADTDAEFRELHMSKVKLPFCLGCSNCFRRGSEVCPHRDVMDGIIADMDWADGVVISTATFNLSPPALFRNLMDHLCYMLHRPHFYLKKALIITTTGGIGAKKSAKVISDLISGIGFNRVYRLPVIAHSWNSFEPNEEQIRQTKEIAAQFAADTVSKKAHPPAFWDLFAYNLFRGMCQWQTADSAYPTEDGVYWTDPARRNSCYDSAVPVRWDQRLIGTLIYRMGKSSGKKTVITYRKKAEA